MSARTNVNQRKKKAPDKRFKSHIRGRQLVKPSYVQPTTPPRAASLPSYRYGQVHEERHPRPSFSLYPIYKYRCALCLLLQSYIHLPSSSVLVWYDYILTFRDALEYFWFDDKSLFTTILYMALHYPLIANVLNLFAITGFLPKVRLYPTYT